MKVFCFCFVCFAAGWSWLWHRWAGLGETTRIFLVAGSNCLLVDDRPEQSSWGNQMGHVVWRWKVLSGECFLSGSFLDWFFSQFDFRKFSISFHFYVCWTVILNIFIFKHILLKSIYCVLTHEPPTKKSCFLCFDRSV